MMDQQNFEAARPVSADTVVSVTPGHPGSVESLARELGLKLGDQNQLTIRRIKRGKSYSFVRANGTAVRHTGTIKRLHSMAVPPAYAEVRYAPDPNSHLQAVGRDAAGRLQYRYHSDWEKVREQRKAHRLGRLVAALPKIRRAIQSGRWVAAMNELTRVAGDEIRAFDEIGGMDRLRTKAQMGNGLGA